MNNHDMHTEAIALFNGEFDFSSMRVERDSADEAREWIPKGLAGVNPPSRNGSGAFL
jgi:hypothetical protein